MVVTRKGTGASAAAGTADEFLQFDHKSVANGKEIEEDDPTLDIKNCERYIVDWIGRPHKPPSSNEGEEYEGKEEEFGATQASTKDNYPNRQIQGRL